jgi:hypothetical protein
VLPVCALSLQELHAEWTGAVQVGGVRYPTLWQSNVDNHKSMHITIFDHDGNRYNQRPHPVCLVELYNAEVMVQGQLIALYTRGRPLNMTYLKEKLPGKILTEADKSSGTADFFAEVEGALPTLVVGSATFTATDGTVDFGPFFAIKGKLGSLIDLRVSCTVEGYHLDPIYAEGLRVGNVKAQLICSPPSYYLASDNSHQHQILNHSISRAAKDSLPESLQEQAATLDPSDPRLRLAYRDSAYYARSREPNWVPPINPPDDFTDWQQWEWEQNCASFQNGT